MIPLIQASSKPPASERGRGARRTGLPRVLRWLGRGLGWFALGTVMLVALALVSINFPPVNRFVSAQVNAALQPTFQGQLLLQKLGHLDFNGVSDAEFEVRDPAGQSVLTARDIDVRLFWPSVAFHALTGSDPLRIPIARLAVQQLEVRLIDDGAGTPTLAHAFEPRDPTPPDPNATKTSIEISELLVAHTRVAGSLASVGPVDADLSDLDSGLRSDASGLKLQLRKLDLQLRQLPQVEQVSGRLTGEVELPAEPERAAADATTPAPPGDAARTQVQALRPAPAERRVQLAFSGQVADSGAAARVRLVGEELLAELEARQISPSTLKRVVPALAPTVPVELTAKVEGRLENLGLEANMQQARSRVSAKGRLRRQGDDTHASLRVDASDFDLSQLLPEVPKTRLELVANADLDSDQTGGRGNYHVVSDGSKVAGEALPRTTLEGELQAPTTRPLHTTGTLEIAEPGAATRIDYNVSSAASGVTGKLFSSTQLDHSTRLRERTGLDARGKLEVRAEVDSAAQQIDADVALDVRDVRHPALSARRVETYLTARGDLSSPELRLRADARGLSASGRSLSRLWLTARGTLDQAVVRLQAVGKNPDRIELSATIAPRAPLQVQNTRGRVCMGTDELRIGAGAIGFAAGRLQVDRLTLDGPGHAEASLRYGRTLEQLDLSANGLDLARILTIAGVQSKLRSAQADLEAHVVSRGGRPSGKLVADVRQIGFAELRGSMHADLGLDHDRINGDARLELTPGGTTRVTLRDVRAPLGGGGLAALSGDISLQGELDLLRVQSLLPLAGLERAEGFLRYDVKLGTLQEGDPPGLRAHLETRSLVLVGQRADVGQTTDAELARLTAPWSVRGVDVNLDAGLERGVAELTGKLFDGQGDLATWNASFRDLPRQRAFAIPASAFVTAPFRAELRVPSRAMEELPAIMRPNDIEGNLALTLDAEGTIANPRVRAHGTVERFAAASDRQRKTHLDVNLDAEYAPVGGRVAMTALRRAQPVLTLDSRWSGDARGVGGALDGKSPIRADVELNLNDFPMGVVPALQQRHIRGRVTGTARLKDFGKDASVELDLRAQELKVERLLVGELHAAIRNVQGKLELQTDIRGKAGEADAHLSAPLAWGDRVVPTSDGQLDGTLQTRGLRLSALLPMLEGSLSELDGELDSDFKASMHKGDNQLSGHASLRDGVIHMPAIGQRFSDISADVTVSPGEIRIEKVKARGVSGGFEAQAQASLAGLVPVSAQASLKIKEDDKLPLTLEGESMGDIWGSVQASYRQDQATQTNTIDVKLDKVHVLLPDASPQGLQDLAQPEYIRVGYRRRDQDFVPIALQLLQEPSEPSEQKTIVVVDLGTVSVVKGQQAKVDLSGKIQATLGDELDVQGRIDTKRGELDISGKTFEIERASVAFTGGKPDDPTIDAVARYDSPAGYTVYAEYTGTANRGKLGMRSEPALSQDEIVTLLLFGTPDGSLGAGNGDSLSTAVSVAGGTAAQGLNRAIADVTDLDVSARVDTSTGAPRPELVLQLTPRVAAKVTQALGEPVPGQSPDRTFVTLDLRLASAWSLSTTVGDRGASAFDLIWRRRY